MRRVYVSPAFFINSIIMGILLAMSLVFIFVFDSIYSVEYIVVGALLGSWSIFFFVTILIAFSKRKGFMHVVIGETCIQNKLFYKKYCSLCLEDINYFAFSKSCNYGFDTDSIYMILSHIQIDPIRNIALSYNPRTQIVVRITKRNYENIIGNIISKIDENVFVDQLSFDRVKIRLTKIETINFKKTDNGWVVQYTK
jgi:hypothetical protein